uniref:Protein kinase domain-containing protein n=1 Tax=Bionectria ochroleuca TaxID=29856 RepID=A0A8H7NBZ7_BIOOC
MASPDLFVASLPELVRDSQLQARFETDGEHRFVVHTRSSSRHLSQEKWRSQRMLGSGGQGAVELQIKQMTESGVPQLRAVKTLNIPSELTSSIGKLHQRELETIAKFSQAKYSDHFVKSFGWFISPGRIHIAMEYCELGDLEKYLSKCPLHRVSEAEAHDISSQILDALCSMHEEKYCHRDLKLANVLIMSTTPSWWIKLADFGLSKRDTTMAQTTAIRGTINYMPPELLGYTGDSDSADPYAVDMWCLGQVVFRLVAGQPMFSSLGNLSRYCRGEMQFPETLLRKYEEIDHNLVNFIQSLTKPQPEDRMSSEKASTHPWIKAEQHYPAPRSFGPGSSTATAFVQDEDSDQPSATWASSETIRPIEHGTNSTNRTTWTALDIAQDEASAEWPSQPTTESVNKTETRTAQPATTTPSNVIDAEKYKIAANRLFKEGKHTQAIVEYTKAIELDPSSTLYLGNRAAAYMATGQYEAALQDCLKGVELDPYAQKIYQRLFRLYTYMGQPEKSIAIFGQNIQRAHRVIAARTDLDRAIQALDEAELGLAPGADVPRKWRLMRAEAYVLMNNRESLSQARRICLSLSGGGTIDGDALTIMGRVDFAEGEMERALMSFQTALECDKTRQDIQTWLGRVENVIGLKEKGNALFREGRFNESHGVYSDALAVVADSKPMRAKLLGNRAQCKLRLGNNEMAISDCDAAIRLDPNYMKVRRTKGTALHNCGRYEEMLQVLEEAHRLDPADKNTVQNIKVAKAAMAQSQHLGKINPADIFALFKKDNVSGSTSTPSTSADPSNKPPPTRPIDPNTTFNKPNSQGANSQGGPASDGTFTISDPQDLFDLFARGKSNDQGGPGSDNQPGESNGPRNPPQDSDMQGPGDRPGRLNINNINPEDVFAAFARNSRGGA